MPTRHDGYFTILLHAHLPFVRHPEHPAFLEENWLFEAMTECYLPLIDLLDSLMNDGVPFRLSLGISPTLCEMLGDRLLRERYGRRLASLIELADKEIHRTRHQADFRRVAEMYAARLRRARRLFEEVCQRDVVSAFRSLQDTGKVEILATAATHPILPLILRPRCVRAQIRMGIRNYQRHFQRCATGFWLPECAYTPGLDHELAAENIRYFILDSHGILFGTPRPKYGIFAPVFCRSRVAACGRDIESSKQVWSAQSGYPGDPAYREFYRDLGYDADAAYISPYLLTGGARHDLGFKYHRITGPVPLAEKQPYDPDAAFRKADEHAAHFLQARRMQVQRLRQALGRRPFLVAPYDAELFGHWWYEGPVFLDLFLRKAAYDQSELRLLTIAEYLAEHPNLQALEPSASTWGDKGYFEVWLNGSNDWIYPLLHRAEDRLLRLVDSYPRATGALGRALNQAARELMLAQASDWAFIMTSGTMANYAEKRMRQHLDAVQNLAAMIESGNIDEAKLASLEERDNIFADMDYRIYA